MKLASVIKVNGQQRDKFLADPDFVYVGRQFAGFPASIWGNPFKANDRRFAPTTSTQPRSSYWCQSPEEAIERFRQQLIGMLYEPPSPANLLNPFGLMANQLDLLQGKTLGCWCGNWQPGEPEISCHAVVLAKLANALENTS